MKCFIHKHCKRLCKTNEIFERMKNMFIYIYNIYVYIYINICTYIGSKKEKQCALNERALLIITNRRTQTPSHLKTYINPIHPTVCPHRMKNPAYICLEISNNFFSCVWFYKLICCMIFFSGENQWML